MYDSNHILLHVLNHIAYWRCDCVSMATPCFAGLAVVLFLLTPPAHAISPFFRSSLLDRIDAPGAPSRSSYLTQDAKWMSQRIDHFTLQDRREFQQRYYEFSDYFEEPKGPIFLKICGESTCGGITNDYSGVLARRFKAAIVSLEHRYYGESSPFVELTTENLVYLTSNQALFDLASFRDFYQGELRSRYDLPYLENPWFVFGVSYSGALSAWFQLKFPHLSQGSLASSGVVQAIFNYTAFDEQVAESAGPACGRALQDVTANVEKGLSKNATFVKSIFGAEQLEVDGDFMYLLADAAAIAFQYGNPDILCGPLVAASMAGEDLLDIFSEYVKGYYLGVFGASIDTYDQEKLKITKSGPKTGDRQWWYQVCTEFAFFQVAPANNSIRSQLVDVKYHLDLCNTVFGKGTYPEVNITNLYYGGAGIAGSKILFTNGSQDPWRHASKETSTLSEPAWLITCHNCGHGTDLRGCPQSPLQLEGDASKCADPNAVHSAREAIIHHIQNCLTVETCARV